MCRTSLTVHVCMATVLDYGRREGRTGGYRGVPTPNRPTLSYTQARITPARITPARISPTPPVPRHTGHLDNRHHVRLVHSAPPVSCTTPGNTAHRRGLRVVRRVPSATTRCQHPMVEENPGVNPSRISPTFIHVMGTTPRDIRPPHPSPDITSETGRRGIDVTLRSGGNLHVGRAAMGPQIGREKAGRVSTTGMAQCEAVQIVDLTVAPVGQGATDRQPRVLPANFPSKPLRSPTYSSLVHKYRVQNGYLQARGAGGLPARPHPPLPSGLAPLPRPLDQEAGLGYQGRPRGQRTPASTITNMTSPTKHHGDDLYKQITDWKSRHRVPDHGNPRAPTYVTFLDNVADLLVPEDHPYVRRRPSTDMKSSHRVSSANRNHGQTATRVSSSRHSRTVDGGDTIAGIQGQGLTSPRTDRVSTRHPADNNDYYWHPQLSVLPPDESLSSSYTDSDDDLQEVSTPDVECGSEELDSNRGVFTDMSVQCGLPKPHRHLQDVDVAMVSTMSPGGVSHVTRTHGNCGVVSMTYKGESPQPLEQADTHLAHVTSRRVVNRNQPLVDLGVDRPDVEVSFDQSLYSGFQHRRFGSRDSKVKRKQRRKASRSKAARPS